MLGPATKEEEKEIFVLGSEGTIVPYLSLLLLSVQRICFFFSLSSSQQLNTYVPPYPPTYVYVCFFAICQVRKPTFFHESYKLLESNKRII